jgi:hypothetical protein
VLIANTMTAHNFAIELNSRMVAPEEDAEVTGDGAAKVGWAMLCVFGWVVVLVVFFSVVPLITNCALWAKIVPAYQCDSGNVQFQKH